MKIIPLYRKLFRRKIVIRKELCMTKYISYTHGLFQLQMRISFSFLLTKNVHRFLLFMRNRSSLYRE